MGILLYTAERQTFLSELKRYNVLRAAMQYAGTIWAFAQGLS